jgi:hypothetical protein
MTNVELNNRNRKIILLIDSNSRTRIRTNLSDLSRENIYIINKLEEIDSNMVKDSNKLIVLEDYLRDSNSVEFLDYYRNKLGLDVLFLGKDKMLICLIENIATVYECDITLLDYNLIQSALYNEDSSLYLRSDNQSYFDEMNDVAEMIKIGNDLYDKMSVRLAEAYSRLMDVNKSLLEKVDLLQSNLEIKDAECINLEAQNKKYRKGYGDVIKRSYKLGNTLKQYEGILTKDIYEKVNLSNYSNKPKIIYIKEYEEIVDMELFISTLFELIRIQKQESVKCLFLFDGRTSKRMVTLPKYFKKIYSKFTTSDLVTNDFLAKTGSHIEVLDALLTNKFKLSNLIIVDCKSANDICILGQSLSLNLCRNPEHVELFSLPEKTTIVNSNSGKNYLEMKDYSKKLSELDSNDDKLLYLSSQVLFQRILELYEIYVNSL